MDRSMPSDLVHKTNNDARVEPETKPWWEWTKEYVTGEFEALHEAVGQVIGMKASEVRGDLLREIGFLKREFAVLKEEVGVVRSLASLKEEIAAARADTPKVPDLVASLKAQQAESRKETARLRCELSAAREQIRTLNVEISQTNYVLSEMEKKPRPTTIDAATLERWRVCIERWLKEHEEPAEPPVLLLPHGHTLPLTEQNNGASSSH